MTMLADRKWLTVLVVLLFLSNSAIAKETPKYIVSSIPEEFRRDVNAVYWEDKMIFQIHADNRATYHCSQVITILNDNAKEMSEIIVPYSKLSKVTSIKGVIYDASGFIVKRIKSSEIYDQSAFDGFSLYSDNRLKYMNLGSGNYPYTIEYEYEIEYKYLFEIPDFFLLGDEKVASLSAEYTLIYPQTLKPRYHTRNIDVKPEVALIGNEESISWKFKNIKPIMFEPHGPHHKEIIPGIEAAPSTFSYEGYSGSMESWQKFGEWINSLNKGRDVLPEATRQKIRSITDDFKDPEEKVMAVYEYLQSKTRYVSIQLGIGGFQPFEASVVDQVGYGDCKALSNYMVSLLAAAGIKSHYVLVNAGRNSPKFNGSFPSSQFNHAIVCVPMSNDTLWLECTSQSNPFGYMGSFTGNRKALAITEKGAVPVNTPAYTEKENRQTRTANVTIDLNGNAKAKVRTTYSGMEYEDGSGELAGTSYDEQKKWIQENTHIPVFDMNSFFVKNNKAKIPSSVLTLDLTLNKFATVSGKRLFLVPNLMNRSTYIPPKSEGRKNKVVLKSSYTHIDTINYTISEQIYPEHLPEAVKIQSRFGEYDSHFELQQGKVVYIRKFVRKSGEFPAESYQELVEFYKGVTKADNTKIVFLNKT